MKVDDSSVHRARSFKNAMQKPVRQRENYFFHPVALQQIQALYILRKICGVPGFRRSQLKFNRSSRGNCIGLIRGVGEYAVCECRKCKLYS
jgi:hypothetical protein